MENKIGINPTLRSHFITDRNRTLGDESIFTGILKNIDC